MRANNRFHAETVFISDEVASGASSVNSVNPRAAKNKVVKKEYHAKIKTSAQSSCINYKTRKSKIRTAGVST